MSGDYFPPNSYFAHQLERIERHMESVWRSLNHDRGHTTIGEAIKTFESQLYAMLGEYPTIYRKLFHEGYTVEDWEALLA